MRAAIAGISQETNSFSQVRCDLDFFRKGMYFADRGEILKLAGTLTEPGGFIKAAQEDGVEIVPTFATATFSSGPITDDAMDYMMGRILSGLREAGRLDAVLLAMHGGMMSASQYDATGYVIEEVRRVVGPDARIGVALDLHANPYPRWLRDADIIVSFHTFPHTEPDLFQTAYDAAKLVFAALRGEIRPAMAMARAPMLAKAEGQSTMGNGVFADMQRQVKALRAADPRILSVSMMPVQPWLDAPDLGFKTIAITDNAPALALETATRMSDQAWERRREFDIKYYKPAEAIQRALEIAGGPVVLSDPADGVGGGAAGDGTHVLKAMLAANLSAPALATCIDPQAVQQAIAAGFGATVTLSVGGKRDPVYNTPALVTGRVKTITDASYRAYGMPVKMGPCVVLEIGAVNLVLITNTAHVINPWVYRAVGLEPLHAKIVLVKSPAQFREEFEPIAAEILMVDAPGICTPNYPSLPYTKLTRPLYPWDDRR
jgi:microcystin degradation protein MlrC